MSDLPAWIPARPRFSVDLCADSRRERDEAEALSVRPTDDELERWLREDGLRVLERVACPSCYAERGEPCRETSSAPHYARARAYART